MSAATTQTLSSPAGERSQATRAPDGAETRWRPALSLPCQITVELPLPNFKVADFLKLRGGSVVTTQWRLTQDVPLRVNGILIGWGEFEGAGTRLAVRVTELA
jgi:flagellar motor switch/type III secretory pathway protein FliN